ncbi:MAG: SDR family oxidoreductase [Alphaproteobacteria bacterium]|nr:SDR family oxidoreductase [Alphaproteobacteria bacterium]
MSGGRSIAQLMDLRGRTAAILGGAGHIGLAAGEALAELGAAVAVIDLAVARPEDAARRIASTHSARTAGIACDLMEADAPARLGRELERFEGRLDILVNCAALVGTSDLEGWAVPFERQGADAWRKAMEVNLTAPFFVIQNLAPRLAASGNGAVVNVASIHGLSGPDWRLYEGTALANPAAYAASKAGLIQATRWLATTLAPRVRVNALSPGGILRGQPRTFVERYEHRTPLGRMGREDDLKGAIAFLASDLSAYVTGENIVVDGGWTAW